jgi:hypothetical protein
MVIHFAYAGGVFATSPTQFVLATPERCDAGALNLKEITTASLRRSATAAVHHFPASTLNPPLHW